MTRADTARLLDRAKGNVVTLGYDICRRAEPAVRKAEKALLCAERQLDRLRERQEKWEARVKQHTLELEGFDGE